MAFFVLRQFARVSNTSLYKSLYRPIILASCLWNISKTVSSVKKYLICTQQLHFQRVEKIFKNFHYTLHISFYLNKWSKISVFKKTNHDINKIWCEFYGVVNLSNYSCNQNELSVWRKVQNSDQHPPNIVIVL